MKILNMFHARWNTVSGRRSKLHTSSAILSILRWNLHRRHPEHRRLRMYRPSYRSHHMLRYSTIHLPRSSQNSSLRSISSALKSLWPTSLKEQQTCRESWVHLRTNWRIFQNASRYSRTLWIEPSTTSIELISAAQKLLLHLQENNLIDK